MLEVQVSDVTAVLISFGVPTALGILFCLKANKTRLRQPALKRQTHKATT